MRKGSKISMLCLTLALLCAAFAGCGKTYYWELGQDMTEVTGIEIINIGDFYADGYTVVCVIDEDDYRWIISDIGNLEAHKYIGSLTDPSGAAVKINFSNGDYDIISQWEPRHCYKTADGYDKGNASRLCYNGAAFDGLIKKWVGR